MGERILREGDGWRIGWDVAKADYPGLVAGHSWAVELTASEFNDLCRLIQKISSTIAELSSTLMEEESVACEVETEHIWIEAEGCPQRYSLHFILLKGRGCEGEWPAEAAAALTAALPAVQAF